MTTTPVTPQMIQLAQQFINKIPFNKLLNIQLDEISSERVVMHLPMRDDLVGNHLQGILHGGAISTILDVAGGGMALMSVFQKLPAEPAVEELMKLARIGTIDLRVDYLRPGRGQLFTAQATLLRSGNKVAVVRSELHNESGDLIATGTGTYLVG